MYKLSTSPALHAILGLHAPKPVTLYSRAIMCTVPTVVARVGADFLHEHGTQHKQGPRLYFLVYFHFYRQREEFNLSLSPCLSGVFSTRMQSALFALKGTRKGWVTLASNAASSAES